MHLYLARPNLAHQINKAVQHLDTASYNKQIMHAKKKAMLLGMIHEKVMVNLGFLLRKLTS